jgi:hypothetical protein
VLVVELKCDQSAEGATAQIKKKEYVDWVKGYTGEILLVRGKNSKETKKHQRRIEILH